jgi:hypothetical protein
MSDIAVHITKNPNQFVATDDPVTLSKSQGHCIQWHNDTQENITITFNSGTPFPGTNYPIPAGGTGHSGAIKGATGTWKYNIEGASGTITDPVVIIQA